MINLRNLAGAFLRNNGNYLLMKRSDARRIAPGVWSGIGGHMMEHEINNPSETCYREIKEEAGIVRNNISSLKLLYIITGRREKDEIYQIYVFFGETSQTDIINTDEGELYWIPEDELLSREYSNIFAAMLEHYTRRSQHDNAVYVGVTDNDNGELKMNWSRCED